MLGSFINSVVSVTIAKKKVVDTWEQMTKAKNTFKTMHMFSKLRRDILIMLFENQSQMLVERYGDKAITNATYKSWVKNLEIFLELIQNVRSCLDQNEQNYSYKFYARLPEKIKKQVELYQKYLQKIYLQKFYIHKYFVTLQELQEVG